MEIPDLSEALDRARMGDEESVSKLFRNLQPRLLRYLRNRAPDAADDIASETWLSVARGLARFEGDGDDFRGWLFTIARRRVADHYRSVGRRIATVSLDATEEQHGSAGTADWIAGDVEDLAIAALSAQEAVDRLVKDLTAEQADVALLRVLADLDVAQVAQVTGRSPGAIRILQFRAMRRLSKMWQEGPITR